MLADNQAQVANSVKLYSGELRYWQGAQPDAVSAVPSPATIYKLYGAVSYQWLTWADAVDVTPGPIADVSDYRLYYTGDGVPKKTNWALATVGSAPYPVNWYHMGVPAPVTAPTVVVTGTGSGATEARAYVYTYLSTFGTLIEESAPSQSSSIVNVQASGHTVTISAFASPPATNYNITGIRIYRTVTGGTTDNYEFVHEISVGTPSYVDNVTVANLGETIQTIGWTPPPDGLGGLVTLPGGTLCGFENNTVYFSEPFYAHAWPVRYALSIPYTIKGLGVFGSTVVVMTERYPYLIHGGIPGGMSLERVPIVEPCVAKQTIVSTADGVIYASTNGLVSLGPSTRGLISGHLYRHDEWMSLHPELMSATTWDNKYIGIFPQLGTPAIIVSSDDVPALSNLTIYATAVFVDDRNADLYYADAADSTIYLHDALEDIPLTFEWKSKRFVMPQPTTFSVLHLDADYKQIQDASAFVAQRAAVVAANALAFPDPLDACLNDWVLNGVQLNGSPHMQNLPDAGSARTVQVLIYGDGDLKATFNMESFDPVRIPPFKSRDIEFKITGNIHTRALTLATTVPELYT